MQRLRIERHGPDPVPSPPSPRVIGTVIVCPQFQAAFGGTGRQLVARGFGIMALQAIDHLVIMVPDLDAAVREYSKLGFAVVLGGSHPTRTHKALIAFADGAYIELIAFGRDNAQHRWWGIAR